MEQQPVTAWREQQGRRATSRYLTEMEQQVGVDGDGGGAQNLMT